MKITIEIDSKSEMEKLSALFKTFKINKVKVISADDTEISIMRGDKKSILQACLAYGQTNRDHWKISVKMPGNGKVILGNGFMRYQYFYSCL